MMKLFSYSMLIVGCFSCTRQPSKESIQQLSRQWMLTSVGNISRDTLVKYRAQIDLGDLKAPKAFFDCNHISFSPKFRNSQGIIFTNVSQTKMYCSPTQATLEQTFGEIAPKIDGYIIDGHQIRFMGNGEVLIKGVAADWD